MLAADRDYDKQVDDVFDDDLNVDSQYADSNLDYDRQHDCHDYDDQDYDDQGYDDQDYDDQDYGDQDYCHQNENHLTHSDYTVRHKLPIDQEEAPQ